LPVNKIAIDKLELSKILDYIAIYANTELGKSEVLATKPFDKTEDAVYSGTLITEAKNLIINNSLPPFVYLSDLRNDISKTSIEGVSIPTKSILGILTLSELSRNLFKYLKNNAEQTKLFQTFAGDLFVDKNFESNIRNILTDEGEIKDSASKELRLIRDSIIEKQENLRRLVGKILKKLSESFLVQEEYTTQRDGRVVIPIKAEHKRHVRGFIHSESSTGQTVYIEPEETLELNNEIMSLVFAEKREIDRILRQLCDYIGKHKNELQKSLRAISKLDAVFAKAQYSIEIMGNFPSVESDKGFQIINGRHPFLLKKLGINKTIPLNLNIKEDKIIVITGPNAGGKTVVLKTIGLLTLMFKSGLHISADPDSNILWFDKILIDIGDQQSLEDDLSTFSSHLLNIKNILDVADSDSLVLLDELGTGTDPIEGSAIATGVLFELRKRNCTVLSTTHHSNLKILAGTTSGFQNSSMLFDTEKFLPTYVFTQGLPGASYAFEIAKRIGLKNELLEESKKYLEAGKSRIEEILFSLEEKSNDLKEKLNKYEIENTRLSALANLYNKKISSLEKDKKEIIKKAKDEASLLLKEVNRKIEIAIKNIRESNADKSIVKKERGQLEKLKENILEKIITANDSKENTHEFKVGDFVSIIDTQTSGEIFALNQDKAIISAGNIKIQAKLNSLIPAKKNKMTDNKSIFNFNTGSTIGLRFDIRGKKSEEAEFEVIKYLDDAYTQNLNTVEILHGKGNGVLKKMVQEILKNNENVNKFYFAKVEFGGEGITVVEFRQE
jgi:DNA mismatch repair protein MutS2